MTLIAKKTLFTGPGTRPVTCSETDLLRINSCDPAAPQRERLEQYIAGIFNAAYGSTVLEYLPLLVYLEQEEGLQAALGLRSANSDQLFCEQYLDKSLEQYISEQFGRTVNRGQLVELGNLVSSRSGLAEPLYLLVVAAMKQAGISHLVIAANRAVRLSIKRCGIQTRELCLADPARLGNMASQWGSYYDGDPRIVLADVTQVVEHGRHHPVISRLWDRQQLVINSLADAIRSERV